MSKKPTRHPSHPSTHRPVEPEPDDEEIVQEEETEAMPEEPKTPEGEPVHPDPEGKMVSYAPGFTVGPDGESVELPKEKKEE